MFDPSCTQPLFFSLTGLVQGLTPRETLARSRERFVDLTVRNWKFWIPAQAIQFAVLPMEWQVPYTCVMGLVWNVILSAAAGDARPVEVPAGRSDEAFRGRVVSARKEQAVVKRKQP